MNSKPRNSDADWSKMMKTFKGLEVGWAVAKSHMK